MSNPNSGQPDISRRSILKFGVLGVAFLATAGLAATLTGCSSGTADGLLIVRRSDLPFLRALLPVMLERSIPPEQMTQAVGVTIRSLDHTLAHLSPESLKLTMELFDAMALTVTRVAMTGIWGRWDDTRPADIRKFLDAWEQSPMALLRMARVSLQQLVMMSRFSHSDSWAACGYPGPPVV